MKLLVGLGNPTPRYALTRHNAGFIFLDLLASEHGWTWTEKKKLHAQQTQGELFGMRCLLLKPQTWMNHSGQAVAAAVNFFRLKPEDVVVIYDDLDVPAGKVKGKATGSSGGHNGVQSIIDCLQSQNFARIKLGVARSQAQSSEQGNAGEQEASVTASQVSGTKWVLGNFSPPELEILRTTMYEQVLLRVQQIIVKARA